MAYIYFPASLCITSPTAMDLHDFRRCIEEHWRTRWTGRGMHLTSSPFNHSLTMSVPVFFPELLPCVSWHSLLWHPPTQSLECSRVIPHVPFFLHWSKRWYLVWIQPNEYQFAIRQWLGRTHRIVNLLLPRYYPQSSQTLCSDLQARERHGHMPLSDVFVYFCHCAHLSNRGHGLTRDHNHTRPADILIASKMGQRLACCSGHYHHSPAISCSKTHKLHSIGPKCLELRWTCIPLLVESYSN